MTAPPHASQAADGTLSRHGDERALLFVALISACALSAAIAGPMLLGRTYFQGDLSAYHVPARAFYAKCLARGDDFTWMPDIYCGYYLHGDGQVGMYHPLHLLIYRILPVVAALNVEIFLSYPFMLVGMYLFLRRWLLRKDASLFGAITFAFCGFNLLHFMHMNGIAIISHLPWLLLLIDVLLRSAGRRSRVLAAAGIALLTGSQLLLGYPQYVMFSLVAEALYALLMLPRRASNAAIAMLLAAKLLGFLLGAVQLLPTIAALAESGRAYKPHSFLYQFSLDPWNFVQFIAPYLLRHRVMEESTHEYGVYDGAFTLVLALWCLLSLRSLAERRRLAVGAIVLALLSLEMSLGEHGRLYPLLMRVHPLQFFRSPCRYIVLFQFCAAILAAVSFDGICRGADGRATARWRKLLWLAAPVVLSIALAGLAFRPQSFSPGFLAPLVRGVSTGRGPAVIGPILLVLAFTLVAAGAKGSRPALAAIIALSAADLGFYGVSYVWRYSPRTLESYEAGLHFPPDAGGYRVLSGQTYSNALTLDGCRLADGYVGLAPARRLDYSATGVMRVASVKWYADPASRGTRWFEVENPLPRARLVTKALPPVGNIRRLEGIDVSSTGVVRDRLTLHEGPSGTAELIADRPGLIRIRTSAPAQQLLVLSESFGDGWGATVDSRSAAVMRAYADFMCCVVGAGEHTVEFRFHGPGIALGKAISASALALLSALVIAVLVGTRGPKSSPR